MKIIFDLPGEVSETDAVLCEWGETYCCVAGFNKAAASLHHLKYFAFDDPQQECTTAPVVDAIKQISTSTSSLIVCNAFPEAILVPEKLYNPDHSYLSFLFGSDRNSHTDTIKEWQLINNYTIPLPVERTIEENFVAIHYYHAFTPALKIYNGHDASSQVGIHFAPHVVRVIAKKEGQIQVAQFYRYTAPLDVVYYLLKIFEEFSFSKEETQVIVSGLIEETSGLYKELRQFILNLEFAKPSTIQFQSEQPSHFFTSMCNLAACVL